MARSAHLSVIIPCFLALVTELPAQAPAPVSRPEIRTSGSGRQIISPDRVLVSISVQVRRRTPSGAGTANAALANTVRNAVTALGVPADSITTLGYSVEMSIPHPGADTGFVASNTVLVRLRRLALIGRVIDTALTAGATRIAGVQYTADDTREAQRRALEGAVLQARRNAEAMARASGGQLGSLITMTTEPASVDPYLSLRGGIITTASSAEVTSITPGPLEVSAWVEARWVFVPDDR